MLLACLLACGAPEPAAVLLGSNAPASAVYKELHRRARLHQLTSGTEQSCRIGERVHSTGERPASTALLLSSQES